MSLIHANKQTGQLPARHLLRTVTQPSELHDCLEEVQRHLLVTNRNGARLATHTASGRPT